MGHATKPMSIVNTIVGFLILFELKQIASTGIVAIFGVIVFFLFIIGGHVLFVIGFIRRSNELHISQNEPIMDIRKNTEKILENDKELRKKVDSIYQRK